MSAELQSYHTFDSILATCYAALSRLPSGAQPTHSEVSLFTPGTLVLALQVQSQEGDAPLAGSNIVELVRNAGLVDQGVLVTLVLLSIWSWAIVLQKAWAFRKIARQNATFLEVFRKSARFSEVQAVCPSLPASPLVGIFQAGYAEITAQLRPPASSNPAAAAPRPMLKSLTAVDRALLRASATEAARLEKRITNLATVASGAPFVGLFGTVWGIMIAFDRIGATGSTNLATVGPGISAALIATAAGLAAAIPAVFLYNHFTTRVKGFATEMDDFSLEFLNIAERNFT